MTATGLQSPVTARWAEALFHVAQRADALDEVRHDTARLSREVSSPAVQQFLFGGSAGQGERSAKMAPLLETLHPLTRNFVKLLMERRRQEVLIGIGEAFKRRVLDAEGALEGTVESVRELDATEVEKIAAAIGEKLGKTVHLKTALNPELVGGVRVLVGARMLDYSVQGRLAGLRQRLLEAPLPSLKA